MDKLLSEQAIVDVLRKGYWDKNLQSAKDDPCVIDAVIDWAIRQIKAIPSTEPSRDMKEIEEVINCNADAETKCKMISNIVYSKPHYFKILEQKPKIEKAIEMRDATPEEREAIDKYIKSISKPTGIEFDKEQEPKTGHWIIIDDCEKFIAKCSKCGRIEDSRMISKYPYCHCGAKMVEEQERSDKE